MAIRTSTESKLLNAADELFFTRGIAATPVDAVLARRPAVALVDELARGKAMEKVLRPTPTAVS